MFIVTISLFSDRIFKSCVLTNIEKKFRLKFNPEHKFHPKSFISNYIERLFKIKFGHKEARILVLSLIFLSYTLSVLILTRVI